MGFWHTGYMEFHEHTGLGNASHFVPSPVQYVCEQCSRAFDALEELRRHRSEQHPLRQPAMFLRGRPLGALPVQLMTSIQIQDVIVEDATHCTINGDAVALTTLGMHLSAMRREYLDLALSNEGATSRFVLDFRIAAPADLEGVERAFARMAQEGLLNLDAVSRFIKECRPFQSATAYYDGICHYLFGVMAKEGAPDSNLGSDQYSERYLRASDVLAGFERPLARSIRALVAFHFNHFNDSEQLAPDGALRRTSRALAGLLEGLPWHLEDPYSPKRADAIEDLLTDQDTLQILDDASRGMLYLKLHTEELLAAIRRMKSGYDRLKRQLLAGEALAARSDDVAGSQARKLARELIGHDAAGAWATAMLEKTRKP